MTIKVTLVLLLVVNAVALGQDRLARSVISIESPGMGAWISLNYDYTFSHKQKGFWDAKLGLGFYQDQLGAPVSLVIPFAMTYNFKIGKRSHFLELGAAGNYIFTKSPYWVGAATYTTDSYNWFSPQLGYRSISKKGLQLRVFAICPYSNRYEPGDWFDYPWPVVSLGKVLKWKNQ